MGLIAAPVVALYFPTVPVELFATKRAVPLPDNASPVGLLSPVMKLALIAAPVVALYLPTVPIELFATKRAVPSAVTASPMGTLSPVMKLALIAAPVAASYFPIVFVVLWLTYSCARALLGTAQSAMMPRTSVQRTRRCAFQLDGIVGLILSLQRIVNCLVAMRNAYPCELISAHRKD